MPGLIIRPERPEDVDSISRITEEAFRDHPHSSHTEQFIIMALRRSGALEFSLVAERDGDVVGHIAFSPVEISDGSPRWYGLGPVAVLPAAQGEGIGRTLTNAGLSVLRESGAPDAWCSESRSTTGVSVSEMMRGAC